MPEQGEEGGSWEGVADSLLGCFPKLTVARAVREEAVGMVPIFHCSLLWDSMEHFLSPAWVAEAVGAFCPGCQL